MKDWIKVGNRHFNLDHVTEVDDDSDDRGTKCTLYLSNSGVPPLKLDGKSAEVILKHFHGCSDDVTPKPKKAKDGDQKPEIPDAVGVPVDVYEDPKTGQKYNRATGQPIGPAREPYDPNKSATFVAHPGAAVNPAEAEVVLPEPEHTAKTETTEDVATGTTETLTNTATGAAKTVTPAPAADDDDDSKGKAKGHAKTAKDEDDDKGKGHAHAGHRHGHK